MWVLYSRKVELTKTDIMGNTMKWLWRGARVLIVSYLGVVFVVWLLENWLVYRPTTAREDWQPAPVADIQDVDLFTSDGTKIHAWWLPYPGADEAILYCHGNAGNLSHRGNSIVKLRDVLKVSVLIFDYPGYGKSEGKPSEGACCRAAEAGYSWLTETQKVDPNRIILYGGSLGGGVAVELGAHKSHRALVLVKTFTSAPDLGAGMFPWLPIHWVMRNRFDNLHKITKCQQPVFIGHGTADRLIPFTHGQRLYEAANQPKEFFTLNGADHNDALPVEFFDGLKHFLKKHPPRKTY